MAAPLGKVLFSSWWEYSRSRAIMLKRPFSLSRRGGHLQDFLFIPDFLNTAEQKTLLEASLKMLDAMEGGQQRRRRRKLEVARKALGVPPGGIETAFLPDEFYEFEEGHYDGVIHHFREMHVTAWPAETPSLTSIIGRLHALCPTKNIQTHIVHLASHGEILPHVDNVQASGSWILGVSLGAERVLRMERPGQDVLEITLPSGSVYLQKDTVRYQYKHSILKAEGGTVTEGQRLSVMIRVSIHVSYQVSVQDLQAVIPGSIGNRMIPSASFSRRRCYFKPDHRMDPILPWTGVTLIPNIYRTRGIAEPIDHPASIDLYNPPQIVSAFRNTKPRSVCECRVVFTDLVDDSAMLWSPIQTR